MILKYGLFTIVMTFIPCCLFVDNFPITILKSAKDLYFELLLHLIDGIKKFTPFNLNNLINYTPKVTKEDTATEIHFKDELFTEEKLKKFNGRESEELYLSILGVVFDVTKGKKYYGLGGSYNIFAGRDASRAFVTGEFTEEGISDDVIDLSFEELRSLKDWLQFYHKEYVYKGKLIGRYFNENGSPTLYNHKLKSRLEEADRDEDAKKQSKLMYPPCNVEWTPEEGSRVWCTKGSGGIYRDWVGVPRKLYETGAKTYRCACINLLNPSKNTFVKEQSLRSRNLEEYIDCHPESSSCYIEK